MRSGRGPTVGMNISHPCPYKKKKKIKEFMSSIYNGLL